MKRMMIVLLTALLVFSVPYSLSAEPAEPVMSNRPLTIAFPKYSSTEYIMKNYRGFIEYLSRALKRKINVKISDNYIDTVDRLEKGSADLAFLSPVLYCAVKDSNNIEFIGVQVVKGKYYYNSVIVARKEDARLSGVQDLTGKTIGFTNQYSASGYLIPLILLNQKGLIGKNSEKKFASRMTGDHEKSLYSLRKHRIDAFATYDTYFDDHSDELKILAQSDIKIPQDTLVANRITLDNSTIISLRNAVIRYHKESNKSFIEDFHFNDDIYKSLLNVIE